MNLQIIFNIPNTIGIIRIVLLYLCIIANDPYFFVFYIISASLDALDGKMARKFNQSTFLGACLDMITDRVSTILIFLRILSKNNELYIFLSFILLTDIFSHFLYFAFAISKNSHHKNPSNYFLRLYYRKNVLLILCTTTELFFLSILFDALYGCASIVKCILCVFCCIKTFFHIVQLYVAVCGLSLYEERNVKTE